MTLDDFIRDNKVTLTWQYANRNPYMPEPPIMNHYKVTLRHGRRQYTTIFSMGVGLKHKPEVRDVLECLAFDAAGIEDTPYYEDWIMNYGYDEDARSKRIYLACCQARDRLEKLFGHDLYQTLFYGIGDDESEGDA